MIALPQAGKKSSCHAAISERRFYLRESMLYYSKGEGTSERIRGILDLSFTYMSFEKEEEGDFYRLIL